MRADALPADLGSPQQWAVIGSVAGLSGAPQAQRGGAWETEATAQQGPRVTPASQPGHCPGGQKGSVASRVISYTASGRNASSASSSSPAPRAWGPAAQDWGLDQLSGCI